MILRWNGCVFREIAGEFIGAFIRLAAANGKDATEKALKKLRSFNRFVCLPLCLRPCMHACMHACQQHDNSSNNRIVQRFGPPKSPCLGVTLYLHCSCSFQGATAALDLLVQRGLEILHGHDQLLSGASKDTSNRRCDPKTVYI